MKLEKTLVEMVGHFTQSRATDWLRLLFASFETDAEPIAVDTTKNESAYFAVYLLICAVHSISWQLLREN